MKKINILKHTATALALGLFCGNASVLGYNQEQIPAQHENSFQEQPEEIQGQEEDLLHSFLEGTEPGTRILEITKVRLERNEISMEGRVEYPDGRIGYAGMRECLPNSLRGPEQDDDLLHSLLEGAEPGARILEITKIRVVRNGISMEGRVKLPDGRIGSTGMMAWLV